MAKKVIKWAVREKKRSVTAGVGKSFLKTITEPVTNADSIQKTKASVPHAAGLVDRLLELKVGDRVDSAELKTTIAQARRRSIHVEITTAGPNARLCRVIDFGLGMSLAELELSSATTLRQKRRVKRPAAYLAGALSTFCSIIKSL